VLSKVALNKGDDQKSIEGYLTRIKDSAQQTMESMSDIVWAINPTNDSLESMLVRMKEYAAELCEARGIELAFDADENMMSRKLDVAYRKNIFLIFKEAVNNAVKYSNCEKLLITLTMLSDHKLHLSVKDNGKGFADVKRNTGNGLHNMQSRAKELGGQLQINTTTGEGTKIELFLPIT
jgi:two-component system sensor histidine kinase UhpB